MSRWLLTILLVGILTASGCSSALQTQSYQHSPDQAARVAQEYVTHLMVEQDVEGAYELMDEDSRGRISCSALEQSVAPSSCFGKVTQVEAVQYQRVPGQPAIDIFLVGNAENEKHYFKVQLSGTMKEGYLVRHFAYGQTPPGPPMLRTDL